MYFLSYFSRKGSKIYQINKKSQQKKFGKSKINYYDVLALARACPRMYADDTNITVSANNAADLKTMLNDELSNLNLWLRANKLSLNITKTEYMIIGSRQRLRATTENQIIEVCIEGKKITRVAESKSLGVYIDETLSWKKHMKELSKKLHLVLAH